MVRLRATWPLLAVLLLPACGSGDRPRDPGAGDRLPPMACRNSGSGTGNSQVHAYSAGSDVWRIWTTRERQPRLEDQLDGSVAYDMPTSEDRRMGYVMCDIEELGDRITLEYTVEGDGTVRAYPDGTACDGVPAQLSIVIQRRGDNWGAEGRYEHYRWWYRQRVDLTPGDHSLTADLSDLTNWSSVYSTTAADDPEAFRDAVDNVARMGVTHGGGGCYAGHGAWVENGTARVVLNVTTR